jgi:glycosyltransferase involved in cell wall biosynthesis
MIENLMTQKQKHIVHLINRINFGGLERKLEQFVHRYPAADARHTVLALEEKGGFLTEFNNCAHVTTIPLGIKPSSNYVSTLSRRVGPILSNLKKMGEIDIVHSWSYPGHAYLAPIQAFLPHIKGRVLAMDLNVMVRPLEEDSLQFKLGTALVRRIAANRNSRVVSISPEMNQGLLARAFKPDNIRFISNGISADYFSPQEGATESVKDELHLSHVRDLVGIASRHGITENETYKDVPGFVYAVAALKQKDPELYSQTGFVICGLGTNKGDLQQLAHQLGVAENVRTLGPRTDMPRLYSSWRISNTCSISEPFGLVVPEAMACETPCVVTDTSLFPEMVGETGRVVPIGDPEARADAWQELLTMPDTEYRIMAQAARARVQEKYSHEAMVREYVDLYSELAAK